MKEDLRKLIERAIKELKRVGNFDFAMPEISIDYPKVETFGDYSTNVAMVLGKILKKNPMEVAEKIVSVIASIAKQSRANTSSELKNEIAASPSAPRNDGGIFEKIEVVKPGYINFYLSKKYLQDKVEEINQQKEKYGDSKIGKGIKVNNEFISANPTGPLHLGNGRGGFLGDSISKVFKKCGYAVTNEYYINDAGEQIIKLGHSVLKDGEAVYTGEYVDELNGKLKNFSDAKEVGGVAAKIIMEEIVKKTATEKMQIVFDVWFSEKKELYDKKYADKAIGILKKKKLTCEKDGALWLRTTEFGDDKDRVLIKKDGQKTYFASDCGYILNKKERGFDRIIEIWGADHHGYISRFRAAAEALGFKEEQVKFIIVQLVRLIKDGKEARMSKRAGNVVYIDELIDEVGLDVVRFFFLMYSPETHMNFDLNLALERSEKNPVYYVQYAHARISSILEKYKVESIKYKAKKNADLFLLTHEKELSLIRELQKFPGLVEEIAKSYEVHKLPYYAIKLADKFHSFYNDCLVLDEKNPKLTAARLKLVKSVKIVLAESLRLMGVKSPNKM